MKCFAISCCSFLMLILSGTHGELWAQANITQVDQAGNPVNDSGYKSNTCDVSVEAWAEDWWSYLWFADQDQDHGENSASASVAVLDANAAGTGNAYGSVLKYAPAKAEVWAKGRFTAQANAYADGNGWGDAAVHSASGSSHRWGYFRINGNGGINNPWGIPAGWVYVVKGTYNLNVSGGGAQWAAVSGPGVSLQLNSIEGLTGTVTRIVPNGLEYSDSITDTFDGDMVTSKSGEWSAVVTPNQIIQVAAGGSAGVYGDEWASMYFQTNMFSLSGEGKATIVITDVIGVPPIRAQDDGEGGLPE